MIHGGLSLQIHMAHQAMMLGKLRAGLRKMSASGKAEKERQAKWDHRSQKTGRASWKAGT